MGASSSKRGLFGRKKKTAPWGRLKRALQGNKKKKKKLALVDKLKLGKLGKKKTKTKRFSLAAGNRKEESAGVVSLKGIFTNNKARKESRKQDKAAGGVGKAAGGVGKVGEKIKRMSLGNTTTSSNKTSSSSSPAPRKSFSFADLKPPKLDLTKLTTPSPAL